MDEAGEPDPPLRWESPLDGKGVEPQPQKTLVSPSEKVKEVILRYNPGLGVTLSSTPWRGWKGNLS